MSLLSRLMLLIFPLLISLACHQEQDQLEHHAQMTTYETNPDEESYVVILFNGVEPNQTESRRELMIRHVIGQIRESNRIHQFDYKMSSAALHDANQVIPYIVVRGIGDFDTAEHYAGLLNKEMRKDIRKTIQKPFPISRTNYLDCVNKNDFQAYKDSLKPKK